MSGLSDLIQIRRVVRENGRWHISLEMPRWLSDDLMRDMGNGGGLFVAGRSVGGGDANPDTASSILVHTYTADEWRRYHANVARLESERVARETSEGEG